MHRQRASVWCALGILLFVNGICFRSDVRADEDRPNVILVLADDLGYGDLGCYGQRLIRTPHLDRLAAEGLRFTNFYAGSTVCAPSRCCLLTGKHTGHVAIRGNVNVLLEESETTIAEVLQSRGYATAAIGKWGVGHPPPPGNPQKHGFGYFFGYLDMWHAHNHFPDFLWKNDEKVHITGNVVKAVGRGGVAVKRAKYSHDLFVAEALGFIRRSVQQEKQFFLYLPFTIPHANNEAGNKGMETPSDAPYTLMMDWKQPQKNHAAMITRLDRSMGDLLKLLDKLDIDEETLILFSSDNGPHSEGGADAGHFESSGGLRGQKRDLYEGGIRVPLIAHWPDTIEEGGVSQHIAASWDVLPTLAELAGAKPPDGIDGVSFLPTLIGKSHEQEQHKYLYWEFHEGGSRQAVRAGQWKAVRPFGRALELFDIRNDAAESTNVAAKHPDVVTWMEGYMKEAHGKSKLFPLKPVPAAKSSGSKAVSLNPKGP